MVLCVGPTLTDEEINGYREEYFFNPDLEESAVYYQVISNPIRLKVLHLLREHGEICVCDMKEIFGISMPAMSQHLAKLRAHKFVQATKKGQTVFYSLNGHPFLKNLLDLQERIDNSENSLNGRPADYTAWHVRN